MSLTNITRCGNMEFHWGERTYVMGIVNVSPDSFSGDGESDIEAAVAQACRFVEEGRGHSGHRRGIHPARVLPGFQLKKKSGG